MRMTLGAVRRLGYLVLLDRYYKGSTSSDQVERLEESAKPLAASSE